MNKYYISKFQIDSFIEPVFDTQKEAEDWLDIYINDLAARDEGLGIKWDECFWRVEQHEQE